MADETTTLADLRQTVASFVAERNWQQFHAPKNLAMSLAIEAAELMEHFQWISVEESRELAANADKLHAVGEELADVISYALALANELKLDVSSTVAAKMVKNAQKYPSDQFRDRYGPDDAGRAR